MTREATSPVGEKSRNNASSRLRGAQLSPSASACDRWLDEQAVLAAREAGRRSPTKLAAAWGVHRSCASRDMSLGNGTGTGRIRNFLRDIHLLAAHPETDAWAVLVRGQIVAHRTDIEARPTDELRAEFWELRDRVRHARAEEGVADETRDAQRYAEALAAQAVAEAKLAAVTAELLRRRVNPLEEGRR